MQFFLFHTICQFNSQIRLFHYFRNFKGLKVSVEENTIKIIILKKIKDCLKQRECNKIDNIYENQKIALKGKTYQKKKQNLRKLKLI